MTLSGRVKNMKWATIGAVLCPLAAYVYVRRWERGIAVTEVLAGIGCCIAFLVGQIALATLQMDTVVIYYEAGIGIFAGVIAFYIWVVRDVKRLVRENNQNYRLT